MKFCWRFCYQFGDTKHHEKERKKTGCDISNQTLVNFLDDRFPLQPSHIQKAMDYVHPGR